MPNIHALLTRVIDKYYFNRPPTESQPPSVLSGEYLTSVNAAGTGLVNLIKANASDKPEIGGIVALSGGLTLTPQAIVPTSDGTTTGTIAATGMLIICTVTSGGANDIAVLPPPVPGTIVVLLNGTTGYELRSSAPATIGINGGTGASAESAIPASTTAILICENATNWKGLQLSSTAGTLAKVEVAA